MILRRLLGEIMTDLGFITVEQIEEALKRQQKFFEEKTLPERLQRARLVSEARMGVDADQIPLLGQILVDMEYLTTEQLAQALDKQESMIDEYRHFDTVELGAAIEIGSIVNSSLNLAEVLALIMKHANRVTRSVASTLMLLDEETGELIFSVPTGPKADQLRDIHLPPGEGFAGWVAQNGKPILVEDAQKDSRFYGKIDEMTGLRTQSLLCVPLKTRGKIVGVLEAINKVDGSGFTEKETQLLSIFAYQAAMAIENARLYAELKERLNQEMQMQKQLSEFEKFRALGQMASGVGHDFNNMLMSIQGNASLLLMGMDPDDPGCQRLKNIEESVRSGTDLTGQLLSFARGDDYELTSLDLNDLVKRSSDMFGRTRKEVTIHRKFNPDLWKTDVDQGQIEQVFLTLYLNASQAMPGGGDLRLETDKMTLEEDEALELNLHPGRYVTVTVADNGLGMDEPTRKRIFDPFFTTRQMGRGTGLGLAAAYGIIKNHGGTIGVESEKGNGASFTIYLPVSEEKLEEKPPEAERIVTGHENILFVDDEQMIVEVADQLLRQLGYRVMIAHGGKEALDIYRKSSEEIEMVILDMIMPDLSGGEVYDRLKKMNPGVKVLLCSGYSIDGQANEILKRGCNGFIQKPFNVARFSQTIRDILDQ